MNLYDVVLIALNCKNDFGTTEIRSSGSSCCICRSVLRPFIRAAAWRRTQLEVLDPKCSRLRSSRAHHSCRVNTGCHWMSLDVTPSVSLSDSFQVLLDGGYLDGMGKTPVALRSMVLPACPLDLCGS